MLQRLLDQLAYNQLYAPEYPEEDRTSLDREEQKLRSWLSEAQRATASSADTDTWLELAATSIAAAVDDLRKGAASSGRKGFERAGEYLKNALQRKSPGATFVSGEDGTVERADSQQGDLIPEKDVVN